VKAPHGTSETAWESRGVSPALPVTALQGACLTACGGLRRNSPCPSSPDRFLRRRDQAPKDLTDLFLETLPESAQSVTSTTPRMERSCKRQVPDSPLSPRETQPQVPGKSPKRRKLPLPVPSLPATPPPTPEACESPRPQDRWAKRPREGAASGPLRRRSHAQRWSPLAGGPLAGGPVMQKRHRACACACCAGAR
jgi:hypothetical protein